MELTGLSPRELRSLAKALRRGEPVGLSLRGAPPRGVRLDEIAPLCHTVDAAEPGLRQTLRAAKAPVARPGNPARVTVVIPASRWPPQGLSALLGQDVAVRVIILSNGSGPRVVPGAEVLRVPWRGHGATRQGAVALVTDPYVLFCTDDAIPLGAGFVRTLVDALDAGGWDAVTARQVPWPDAAVVTKERLRRWTPAGTKVVQAPQVDHVAALYRTETLRRWPLPDVPIAEDAWWSKGRRVGYVPTAPVLHSHPRSPGDLLRRNRLIHAELVRMGRPPTVPTAHDLLSSLPGLVRPMFMSGPGELANGAAELLGMWLGARRGGRRR